MNKYLKQLLDARAAKNIALQGLMTKSLDAGGTPDDVVEAEIQVIEKDIEVIEKNIERVKKQIAAADEAGQTGTPVAGANEEEAANTASGKGAADPRIEIVPLAKGIGFAQFARAKICSQLAAKQGNYVSAVDMAKQMGFGDEVNDLVQKATVGTTTDVNFAAALVQENRLVGEFVDMLQAATIFDKLTGMRPVPFDTTIPSKTKRGKAQWVGEGKKKPLTNPEFGDIKIGHHKLAAIAVFTEELMRRSNPSVDALVRDDLIEAGQILIDETFIGAQEGTDVIPVGMLYGVTAIKASGSDAAAYDKDLQDLTDKFLEANLSLDGSYYLMSETRASRMGNLRDPLGRYLYPEMRNQEKQLNGLPVITSQTIGDKIILIKTTELLLAKEGGVDVSYSDQATLENEDGTMINLWQENKIAVRVENFITWAKRRPIAAQWIDYTTP